MKLKIDEFSIFVKFLKCSSKESTNQFFKRKCKTAFPTKFKTMNLKADAWSVFLIFISIGGFFHPAPYT